MAALGRAQSDDSVTQRDDVKALAWRQLYDSKQNVWDKTFPHVKGQDEIWSEFRRKFQKQEARIFAAERIALEVVLRARLIQQLVYKAYRAECEAELSSFLWLLFSCIQLCDVSGEDSQPREFSLELSDKPEPPSTSPLRKSRSASPRQNSSGNSNSGNCGQNMSAKDATTSIEQGVDLGGKPPISPPKGNQTPSPDASGDRNSSHRSGQNMSVPGDGISEQETLKLGGTFLKPDMTILCRERNVFYRSAVVEVKEGDLTLPHIKQSFCQGIVATVANRLRGYTHTTRSLLINSDRMVILEYTVDDGFIKAMKDSNKGLADISPADVKGCVELVFAGPFDFNLVNVPARRALIGLLAPSLRHEERLEDMRKHLQVLRDDSTMKSVGLSNLCPTDRKLWEETDDVYSLSKSAPSTVSDACLIGIATQVPSSKRKRDNDLASDGSPKKAHKTVSEIAASDEMPLRDVPMKLSDIQLWANVKSILATADLTKFSMCDLMRQLHERIDVDMSCKRDIIESFAHILLNTSHMG